MKSNKLLTRQVQKFLPGHLQNEPSLQRFLQAVHDSYNAYERDNELAGRAFTISEEEYKRINQKLAAEAAVKKLSIDQLKETVKEIDPHAISPYNDEILEIISYLKLQMQKRTNAERELRRLSLVASANDNGVVFTSPSGQIFWCNEGFCKMTGFNHSLVLGRTPVELRRGGIQTLLLFN